MRNLLGRLHARPDADLAMIAEFWRVPPVRDRPSLIGAIVRAANDPRAGRDAWDRLDPIERAMIRELSLAAAEADGPTLVDLASRLDTDEASAHAIASQLYHFGLLTREGDDGPLPVGTSPRLFLPREVASLFRRVQDEIDIGDLSDTPLPALLGLLDDAEIEAAAAVWGISVLPGLRGREELGRRLLRQLGESERVDKFTSSLRHDASRLWQRVREAPGSQAVPLSLAAADAGLAGDEPRTAGRLRQALADLESSLLLWHTYRPDGQRWLFVPEAIRSPRPPPAPVLPPLLPIIAPMVEPPPWRPPFALAWDLLTLLREISLPDAPPWLAGEMPPSRLHRLGDRLWCQDDDLPPTGYLDFLIALALAENLVAESEPGAHLRPRLVLAAGARSWRDRSFAQQQDRLRWWWLASEDWIEGRERGEVQVWGADWRGARRKLLSLLAAEAIALEPGVWYAIDSVAARIAAHDPDLLGGTFTAATARASAGATASTTGAAGAGAGDDDEATRLAAIAAVLLVELKTAFAWFGLVEVADIPGQARAVRVPPSAQPAEASAAAGSPAAVGVNAEGEITLHDPTPLRVWSLSAFAEPVSLGPISRYRLSPTSLTRALAAGFDLDQVTAFLVRQTGQPLPPLLVATLAEWAHGYRRVRLRAAILLQPDDQDALAALKQLFLKSGVIAHPLADGRLLIEAITPIADLEQFVTARLREAGYAPLSSPSPQPPPSASRRRERHPH